MTTIATTATAITTTTRTTSNCCNYLYSYNYDYLYCSYHYYHHSYLQLQLLLQLLLLLPVEPLFSLLAAQRLFQQPEACRHLLDPARCECVGAPDLLRVFLEVHRKRALMRLAEVIRAHWRSLRRKCLLLVCSDTLLIVPVCAPLAARQKPPTLTPHTQPLSWNIRTQTFANDVVFLSFFLCDSRLTSPSSQVYSLKTFQESP